MRRTAALLTGWRFFAGDLAPRSHAEGWGGAKAKAFSFGAAAASFDDSGWREITIPHDFVHEQEPVRRRESFDGAGRVPDMEAIDSRHFAGGSLEGGVAWYRKRFVLSALFGGAGEAASDSAEGAGALSDRCYYLTFDGVYRNSTVYLNEHLIGTNESGYIGVTYNVSDYIYTDRENLLAVRVDATEREGWWYEGGGINRPVRLTETERLHIKTDGVFVQASPVWADETPAAAAEWSEGARTASAARVIVETEVENRREFPVLTRRGGERTGAEVSIRSTVLDADGRVAAERTDTLSVDGWSEKTLRQELTFSDAALWSPEHPCLYTLRTEVFESGACARGGAREEKRTGRDAAPAVCRDETETRFGVREFVFAADRGLLLNRAPYRVKGFCFHSDHAGVGIAIPEEVWRYRIRRMKETGANAVRCAHHPPDPAFLSLCDEMGMLVMDETRKASVSAEGLSQFRRMLLRDRNHPSIYCWSVGNEEINLQLTPEAPRVLRTLRAEAHRLDPGRAVTLALVYWNPNAKDGNVRGISVADMLPMASQLDVAGFNYQPNHWDAFRALAPDVPMMNTEAHTGAWTRGCYATDAAQGFFCRFDEKSAERGVAGWSPNNRFAALESFRMYMERGDLSGYFLWTAFDYRGEPTPMPWPAVSSQFGVLDACGFDKDITYFYKSWWCGEPVLHLFRVGESVYCFSNFDEIELFSGPRSLGRKTMERYWFLVWENIPEKLSRGEDALLAVAYRDGREVMRRMSADFGAAAELSLIAEPEAEGLCANGRDVAIVEARIVDDRGRIVATADRSVRFFVSGAGEFLGAGNGDPGSHASDILPVRRAFAGRCQLMVRTKEEAGELIIRAEAEGLAPAECRLPVRKA